MADDVVVARVRRVLVAARAWAEKNSDLDPQLQTDEALNEEILG
jgi:hypothetical protein